MKYIKRILIILFLVIMISGCKVDYELKINKDLSVNEKVRASENTNRMRSRTNLDVNQSVKYLYKIYKLKDMEDDNYSVNSGTNITTVTVLNSYKDLDEYSEKFSNELFELDITNTKDNNKKITISQTDIIDSKASSRYVYDQINISVELPFEVIKTNASTVKGNKYSWIVSADSKELKEMYIEFDSKKEKDTVSFSFGKRSVSLKYELIFIGALILIIGIILAYVYIKNKKNNKM